MPRFQIEAPLRARRATNPAAIASRRRGSHRGDRFQTLLGSSTGTGEDPHHGPRDRENQWAAGAASMSHNKDVCVRAQLYGE